MDHELWLGSLSLYKSYTDRSSKAQEAMLSGWGDEPDEHDDQCSEPDNFTLFDNVAVIDVTGTLTNDDSFWTRMMGDTSYNQIRRAQIEAATHQNVKCIVLNIDSGGGTPNGLADVADINQQISKLGIPVYAYTGGVMASAAYWLGASCDKVFCGETADVGSIGVISIHKEYTGMLKQDGIKATVMRAGSEKALGNPYETLSDKAKANIQDRIDTLYDVFINNIAKFRGYSPEYVKEKMADGKEFIGQQAYDIGLVDGITTLDSLIKDLQNKHQPAGKETHDMATKKTRVLTQAMQDALLEGVATETVLASADPDEQPAESTEEQVEEVAATETTTELSTSPSPTEQVGVVDFLRSELSSKTAEVIRLSTELESMKSKMAAMESVHDPMKKLVAASVGRMQVALGSTPIDMADMPAELVLAQHGKIMESFCKKFPVGGVASVQPEDNSVQTASVQPLNVAKLRQAKI